MKGNRNECSQKPFGSAATPSEDLSNSEAEGLDLSLIEESLAMTPWERMKANDDAVRFADTLRNAMEELNAKSRGTNSQIG